MAISYLTDMRDINGKPPTAAHYDEQIKVAQQAEELGYKTVWVPEDHVMDDGFCPSPLTTLAAFARETKRIRLATGILQVPLTHPRRILEDACVVDVMSHGRLTLGFGIGGYEREYQAFGVSWADRGKLTEEGIKFIKQGLSGGPIADGLPLSVPPVQRPIPIVIGSRTRVATERAARLTDGHFGTCHMDPESALAKKWNEEVWPAMQKYGRSLGSFQLSMLMTIWASDNYLDDWHEFVGPGFVYRTSKYLEGWDENSIGPHFRVLHEAEKSGIDEMRARMLIDTPKNIAVRLKHLRTIFPFDELVLMKVQGIPQEHWVKFMQTIREQVAPVVFPEEKW